MSILKIIQVFLAVLLLTACASVTVKSRINQVIDYPPKYEERATLYFFWLVGEKRIDVAEICEKEVSQMQTILMPTDFLLALFTATIYSPITIRVWCDP